jgi:hypothetical protein
MNNNTIKKIQHKKGTDYYKRAEKKCICWIIIPNFILFIPLRIYPLIHNPDPTLSQRNHKHRQHRMKNIIEILILSNPISTVIHTVMFSLYQRLLHTFNMIHYTIIVGTFELVHTKYTEKKEEYETK